MDKLELDARVARLERRINGLVAGACFLGAGLAFVLLFFARAVREDVPRAHASVVTPAPFALPPPMPVPAENIGMMGMMATSGSMDTLHHQLTSFRNLLDQGLISQEEWQAKKDRLLAAPITAADLRSDLERVRQLRDMGVLCDDERDALRARLLGIEE